MDQSYQLQRTFKISRPKSKWTEEINKIKKFEANLILSQSDSIFMHLSIVSGTVGRAGDPREIDQAKSSLGQRFDRQLYPTSGEIDNPLLTLMIHFLTAQYCSYCCPLLCLCIYSLSPGFWQSFISIEVEAAETVYRHLHHPAKNN